MRIEGIKGEKASADEHVDLYAELGSSDKGVIRTWQRNVNAISMNCLALWNCRDGDKRDNVAFVLQAAFTIVPKEWNIKDKYLVALYFRLFCVRLGLLKDASYYHNASYYRRRDTVELGSIVFFFTYDQQASVSFLTATIPETLGLPDIKFCVNYNPSRRTIDKPYSADFSWRQLFPNCCVPAGYGGNQCESECTRFDKTGRGVDFVPQDVNEIAAWLQQTWQEITKERRKCEEEEREKAEQIKRTINAIERGDKEAKKTLERLRFESLKKTGALETDEVTESDETPLFAKIVFAGILLLLLFVIMKSCTR